MTTTETTIKRTETREETATRLLNDPIVKEDMWISANPKVRFNQLVEETYSVEETIEGLVEKMEDAKKGNKSPLGILYNPTELKEMINVYCVRWGFEVIA